MEQLEYGWYYDVDTYKGSYDYSYEGFMITCELEAGKEYYIQPFGDAQSSSNGVRFTLNVDAKKTFSDLLPAGAELTIASDKTESKLTYFSSNKQNDNYYDEVVKFTADKDGFYEFVLVDTKLPYEYMHIDTIVDENGNMVEYVKLQSDVKSEDSKFIRYISAYLKKGVYYCVFENWSGDENYTVSVNRKPEITSLKVTKKDDTTKLVRGEDGYWETENDEDGNYIGEYYKFYDSNIIGMYDIKVTYEDGVERTYEPYDIIFDRDYGDRISISTNQSYQNPWSGTNDNNILTIVADVFKEEIQVPVKEEPKISGVDIIADEEFCLYYGTGGDWQSEWDDDKQEYVNTWYSFYLYGVNWEDSQSSLHDNVRVKVNYDDGSSKEYELYDSVWSHDENYSYTDNQSRINQWLPGETDNTFSVTVDGITASYNVPVKPFSDKYVSCTALELDKLTQITYKNGYSETGAVKFTPSEDGTYYLLTHTYYDFGNATYQVGVSKTDVTISNPFAELSGLDLTGKYINLAFVVDTTSSMGEEIAAVRDNLKEFVDAIASTNATLRIALIDYRDLEENEETVLHEAPSMSIWYENADVEALKTEIGNLEARGGGDEPESLVDALGNVADSSIMNFNSAAAKFVFVVTDASYKDDNNHDLYGMYDVIDKLQTQNIATSVITGKSKYFYYNDLSHSTKGTMMNIEGDFRSIMGRYAAKIAQDTSEFTPDDDIVPVQNISLGDDLTIPHGKVRNFTPVITPENATDKRVEWEIEDESIAKISEELTTEDVLVIQGVSVGETRILARSKDGGYTAYFNLTVSESVQTEEEFQSCDLKAILEKLKEVADTIIDYIYYDDTATGKALSVAGDVQKDIYSAIKETDKNISFVHNNDYGDLKYGWKFAGKDIKKPEIEVDFGIDVNKEGSESNDKAVEEEWEYFATFDFAHEGELPGTATVSASVDGIKDGNCTLLHYNKGKKSYEVCGFAKVENGVSTFDIDHCSSYAIVPNDIKGDVNGDFKVNLADAVLVLKAALNIIQLEEAQIDAAEVDGKESISLKDAQLVLQAALNIIQL